MAAIRDRFLAWDCGIVSGVSVDNLTIVPRSTAGANA